MAEAMVGGLMTSGLQPADKVHLYDTNEARLALYCNRWEGMNAHGSVVECVDGADVVLDPVAVLVAVGPDEDGAVLPAHGHDAAGRVMMANARAEFKRACGDGDAWRGVADTGVRCGRGRARRVSAWLP